MSGDTNTHGAGVFISTSCYVLFVNTTILNSVPRPLLTARPRASTALRAAGTESVYNLAPPTSTTGATYILPAPAGRYASPSFLCQEVANPVCAKQNEYGDVVNECFQYCDVGAATVKPENAASTRARWTGFAPCCRSTTTRSVTRCSARRCEAGPSSTCLLKHSVTFRQPARWASGATASIHLVRAPLDMHHGTKAAKRRQPALVPAPPATIAHPAASIRSRVRLWETRSKHATS